MNRRPFGLLATLAFASLLTLASTNAQPLDGGTLRILPHNGWRAFEVITLGDDPAGDGENYSMPSVFDGVGAQALGNTLRIQVNHENSDASISEVDVRLSDFRLAVANVLGTGNLGGVSFVQRARQAYDRWSDDGGATWTATTNNSTTSFARFCSSQSYAANLFGPNRGFVDELYITGEEVDDGRLFVLDLTARDLYSLSGVTGSGGGGIGGMPFDSWENAALLDTGETDHVALLLSPDGDTEILQLYIGLKGRGLDGSPSSGLLARNGLAFGSTYLLNDSLPSAVGTSSTNGFFDTNLIGALASSKLEDVDTSPSDPTRMVLGDQTSGLFVFDFDLQFVSGALDATSSGFSITKIEDDNVSALESFHNPDNVDWTAATELGGTLFPEGLIFVNEDSDDGEIWMIEPDGSGLSRVASTVDDTESSGVLDISALVGYLPGSVLLTSNQGDNASLTVLLHPDATLEPTPGAIDVCFGDGGDSMGCTDCPCLNNAMPGTIGGCLNSAGRSARLFPSGQPSVAQDTLRFQLTGGSSTAFAILSSGDNLAPTNPMNPCFGLNSGIESPSFDGLRCTVGGVQRHGTRATDLAGDVGTTTPGWGFPNGPPGGLIAQGGFAAGQVRHYQVIYREEATLGCLTGLNTSQAVSVVFVP